MASPPPSVPFSRKQTKTRFVRLLYVMQSGKHIELVVVTLRVSAGCPQACASLLDFVDKLNEAAKNRKISEISLSSASEVG
jgi:hypothetical protein